MEIYHLIIVVTRTLDNISKIYLNSNACFTSFEKDNRCSNAKLLKFDI